MIEEKSTQQINAIERELKTLKYQCLKKKISIFSSP
jgi:hypothetical protein